MFKIEIFFVCDVYRTFVPIKFSYISPYKHYEMAFALVPHSCQNLHFKSCFLILWKRRNTTMAISIILSQPCCTQIILCGLRMIPFVSTLDCSMLLWSSGQAKYNLNRLCRQNTLHILIFCLDGKDVFLVVDQILVSFSPYWDGDTYQMEMHTRSFKILNLQS